MIEQNEINVQRKLAKQTKLIITQSHISIAQGEF